MPVYNAGSFLMEAIESILTQSYKNFELIIIDDASTDNSWKIISSFKRRFPKRIKAVRLTKNLNMGGDAAGNVGFDLAQGEFIARMDADDIARPERLKKQVSYLKTHPGISVLGSRAYVLNKDGDFVGNKNVPLTHKEIYKEYFVFHPMIHSTVMIRRSSLKRVENLYYLSYNANNDYLTFFEMIARGDRFANLPDKLLYYRIHGKNDSLVNVKSRFINSIKIRLRAVFEFGYKPTIKGAVKLAAQTGIVLLVPERLIVPLYLMIRGISKPRLNFGFVRKTAFSQVQ